MKNGISENTEKARIDLDEKYVVKNGDILFSWSGTLELMIWNYEKGALNQHIFKVTSEEYKKWFYSDPSRLREIEGLALEEMVVESLLAKAKVSEDIISFKELTSGAKAK